MKDLKKKKSELKIKLLSSWLYVSKIYESMGCVLLVLFAFAYGVILLQWGTNPRYVVGQPAPQHYITLHGAKYVDDEAVSNLKTLAEKRLVGVLVKDDESKQNFNVALQYLRSINNLTLSVPIKDFPQELFNAIKKIPEAERNALLSDVEKIGAALSSPTIEGQLLISQRAWAEIDKLGLPPDRANIVYQILESTFKNTVKVDGHLTAQYKQQEVEKIPLVERKIEVGDIIVERGRIITPKLGEVLLEQGYIGDDFPVETLVFSCALILLLPFWFAVGAECVGKTRRPPPWFFISLIVGLSWLIQSWGEYIGVIGIGSWFLIVASFIILPRVLALYVTLGGHFISTFLMIGMSYGAKGLLLFLGIVGSIAGYYILRDMVSRRKIMQRVIVFGLFFVLFGIVLRYVVELKHLWLESLLLFVLGLAASLAFTLSLPFVEGILGILTPMRLREICHPSVPLLKKLQVEIPGTYQHALVLGSLAEMVGEELELDGNLMKAGACYHDIGKLRRPLYYVENQIGVGNIQDSLSPPLSALTIIAHVREGLELADEYGLPPEVIDFIAEHHGTTFLSYFYKKAIAEGLNVSEEQFCYPGPKPQSRETALLMLLDSMEAAVRANSGNISGVTDIEKIIDRVINMKLSEKQLDDIDFSFRDIAKIKSVMLKAFQSMYHTRKIKEIKEGTKNS